MISWVRWRRLAGRPYSPRPKFGHEWSPFAKIVCHAAIGLSSHAPDRNARLAAEQRAQVLIDSQLVAASLEVQDKNDVNLFAAEDVAVREAVMAAVFELEPKRFFPP